MPAATSVDLPPRVPSYRAASLPPPVLGSPGAQWPQQWPPGINVGMGLMPPAAHAAPFLLSTRAGGPRANTPLDARDTLVRALSDPTALLRPPGS